MNRTSREDQVEDALARMAALDVQQAAIEEAEADGASVEVPEFSAATLDAIVAASVQAAEPRPQPSRAWLWSGAAVAALAAAMLLWWSRPAPPVAPLGTPELVLGGTARTLGDEPPVRPYGPGDSFALHLRFAETPGPVAAHLVALDAEGGSRTLSLPWVDQDDGGRFEGAIAELLTPGRWTLRAYYGRPQACAPETVEGCRSLETQVDVLAP